MFACRILTLVALVLLITKGISPQFPPFPPFPLCPLFPRPRPRGATGRSSRDMASERRRGDRFARHWHGVVRLDDAGIAVAAAADRDLAHAVARHKSMFFAEKGADGSPVDYEAAINGMLQLVPSGEARARAAPCAS